MTAPIPVVFCFDASYAPYAAVATFSLHQSSKSALKTVWVFPSRDGENAARLQALLGNLNIPITMRPVDEARFEGWKVSHHFSRAMYLKLLVPELVNEDRAIYMDCDTLVLGDLSPLYGVDLGGMPLGGVLDPKGGKTSKVPRGPRDVYINSGVMLMDLALLRQENFLAKAEEIYAGHLDTITWPDQCIINKYAEGKKRLLDPRWNRQVLSGEIKDGDWKRIADPQETGIVHFVGGIKPWQEWCSPEVAAFWWRHASQLKIPGFAPVKMTTINQALSLASVLDLNEKFKDASGIKSEIIQVLTEHLEVAKAK